MMYLLWYSDNKKTAIADRIRGGIGAYKDRFKHAPSIVLVSADDVVALGAGMVDGIEVKSEAFVRSNNYWIGPV